MAFTLDDIKHLPVHSTDCEWPPEVVERADIGTLREGSNEITMIRGAYVCCVLRYDLPTLRDRIDLCIKAVNESGEPSGEHIFDTKCICYYTQL